MFYEGRVVTNRQRKIFNKMFSEVIAHLDLQTLFVISLVVSVEKSRTKNVYLIRKALITKIKKRTC